MTENKKVWFITGAGRGMGVDITKEALAAGNQVVATGRNTDRVAKALGDDENLLVVKLDVTSPAAIGWNPIIDTKFGNYFTKKLYV